MDGESDWDFPHTPRGLADAFERARLRSITFYPRLAELREHEGASRRVLELFENGYRVTLEQT